jgi:hypothetical protein
MNNLNFKDSYCKIGTDHWIFNSLSTLKLNILKWNAWSPSIKEHQNWIDWAKEVNIINALDLPKDETLLSPSIAFLPIPLRKKLSSITKVMLYLFHFTLNEEERVSTQVVFSSRYGEAKSTIELLEALGKSEPGSPMAFSRSVHNFAIGLNSIASSNKSPNTAISAMENSFYAGLLESLIQLHTSDCNEIIYIYAEDSSPDIFEKFYKITVPFGIALVLSKNSRACIEIVDQKSLLYQSMKCNLDVENEALQFLKNIIRIENNLGL